MILFQQYLHGLFFKPKPDFIHIRNIVNGYANNPDPAIQAYWRKIAPDGEIPSPEQVIAVLAKEIKK